MRVGKSSLAANDAQEKIMNTISRLILIAGILLVGFPLEGQQRTFQYLENRLVETFDPLTYDPNPVNDRLSSLLYASLFTVDEYSQPVLDMAEKIEPDPKRAKTFVITLRKGLKWSDGSPVSSEDVVFTISLIRNKETNCSGNPPLRYFLSQVAEKPQYIDPLRLGITFDRKLTTKEAMIRLTFPVLPKKVLKEPVLKRNSPFAAEPVGSGAFHIAPGFAVGAHLLRSPSYHRFDISNTRFVEDIQMVGFPDDVSRVQSFKSGRYHLLVDVPWESLPQIGATFKILPYESLSFHYIAFNFRSALLKRPEVRKALSMAIDRKRLIGSVYTATAAELVSGPFPSGSPYIDASVMPDPYDPNGAKALLAKAGLMDSNGDGLLEISGQPINLRLLYLELQGSEGNAIRSACEFIEGQFRAVGIKVTLSRYPSSVFSRKLKDDHDFDLAFNQWRFTDGEGDPTTLFSTIETGLESYNYIGYSNPKTDELFRKFKTAGDPDIRKQVGKKIHALLAEERPYIFLWSLKFNSAFNPKLVTNISINPFAYFDSIMKWVIKK